MTLNDNYINMKLHKTSFVFMTCHVMIMKVSCLTHTPSSKVLPNFLLISGINCILKYIKLENSYFKL